MNKYELILILNPDLSSKFGPYQEHLEGVLNQLSFEIKYCENIGTRSLAYSILNHNKAHYLIYQELFDFVDLRALFVLPFQLHLLLLLF